MPKRSSSPERPPSDEVKSAFVTMQHIIESTEGTPPKKEKNPAAVALGKLGGLKGGKARANALSKSARSKIASKAAKARWKRHSNKQTG